MMDWGWVIVLALIAVWGSVWWVADYVQVWGSKTLGKARRARWLIHAADTIVAAFGVLLFWWGHKLVASFLIVGAVFVSGDAEHDYRDWVRQDRERRRAAELGWTDQEMSKQSERR